MSKIIKFYLLAALMAVVVPAAGAYDNPEAYGSAPPMAPANYGTKAPMKSESYGTTISNKIGEGVSNMMLGWLEIPKNMMNTNNEVNLALGLIGGPVKGVLHSMGRVMVGVFDILTFPVPTQTLTTPPYVWENFNVETRYNPIKLKQ